MTKVLCQFHGSGSSARWKHYRQRQAGAVRNRIRCLTRKLAGDMQRPLRNRVASRPDDQRYRWDVMIVFICGRFLTGYHVLIGLPLKLRRRVFLTQLSKVHLFLTTNKTVVTFLFKIATSERKSSSEKRK